MLKLAAERKTRRFFFGYADQTNAGSLVSCSITNQHVDLLGLHSQWKEAYNAPTNPFACKLLIRIDRTAQFKQW